MSVILWNFKKALGSTTKRVFFQAIEGKVHPTLKTESLSAHSLAERKSVEVSHSTKHFWSFTEKQCYSIYCKKKKNWRRWRLKMAHYSSSSIIQVSRRPKIPRWCEKMIFTPFKYHPQIHLRGFQRLGCQTSCMELFYYFVFLRFFHVLKRVPIYIHFSWITTRQLVLHQHESEKGFHFWVNLSFNKENNIIIIIVWHHSSWHS